MGKDNRSLFFIAGLIVLLSGGVYFWLNSETRGTKGGTPALLSSAEGNLPNNFVEVPVLTNKNTKTSNPSGRYTIDINYPEVALSGHPELAKEANDVIIAFTKDTTTKFTENIKDMLSPSLSDEFSSDLTMRWTPLLVSPSIISIRFDYSEYVAGAAHPDNRTRMLNYDFEKHLLLSPISLFASSTQALPFLSTFSRNALRTQFGDSSESTLTDFVIPGTEPTHENFQEVGITKTGLLVVFNPYQVAPYARGTVEVPISLIEMSNASNTPASLLLPDVLTAIQLSTTNFKEATKE